LESSQRIPLYNENVLIKKKKKKKKERKKKTMYAVMCHNRGIEKLFISFFGRKRE
jgi:hypothetical protein